MAITVGNGIAKKTFPLFSIVLYKVRGREIDENDRNSGLFFTVTKTNSIWTETCLQYTCHILNLRLHDTSVA